MISGGAFAIAALSAIIGFYMLVSFYSSHKMSLPTIIIAQIIVMTLAAIILSACLSDGCFAKQGKLIGCILVIMTLFFRIFWHYITLNRTVDERGNGCFANELHHFLLSFPLRYQRHTRHHFSVGAKKIQEPLPCLHDNRPSCSSGGHNRKCTYANTPRPKHFESAHGGRWFFCPWYKLYEID